MHGTYEANTAMHESDLILGVGVRFDDRTTNNLDKYCPNAKVIQIDIDPTSISKNVPAAIPIVGNAKNVLDEFLSLLGEEIGSRPQNHLEDWWKQIDEWKAKKMLGFRPHFRRHQTTASDGSGISHYKRPSLCGIGCRATPNVCCITLSV